jgi:hypothetical protein
VQCLVVNRSAAPALLFRRPNGVMMTSQRTVQFQTALAVVKRTAAAGWTSQLER